MARWIVRVSTVVVAVVIAACSDDSSSPATCPDETTVGSGAACSTDAQKCTGSVDVGACPGQAAMIAEYDCTCTAGKWSCPQPAAPMCPADGGPDADAALDAPSDAATAGDAASE